LHRLSRRIDDQELTEKRGGTLTLVPVITLCRLRAGRVVVPLLVALAALQPPCRAQQSPHGKLTIPCEQCHSAESWTVMASPMKFSHASTRFALRGQHVNVACKSCHSSLTFSGTKSLCADCHGDIHRGELGKQCDRCHSPQSWLVADMVQKHKNSRFPLLGVHATAECRACHPNQQNNEYSGLRTDCFACHAGDYAAAKNPDHRAAGFSTDCSQCHAINAFSWGGDFNHAATAFPLSGAHIAVACTQCHTGRSFSAAPTDCYSCHRQVFTTAVNPRHSGFPTTCTTCHTTAAWHPSTFDHNATAFKLTGAHQGVACTECHRNGVFAGTPTACVSCHQQNFAATVNPKHTGFSTNCTSCHTTLAWRPASFDHATTAFKLTGAHLAVACADCHKNGVFAGTPVTCYPCHQQQFTAAANPRHTGLSTDCNTCHTTAAWRPSLFDHNTTAFKLTGAHLTATCGQCHLNGVYTGTAAVCYGCHQQDFTGAVNPKHTGFSTSCATCHSTTAWRPASFDHNTTAFKLTGAHVAVPCTQCHVNGVYTGTSTLCYKCHQQAYTTASNPLHTGFSTDCSTCHTTTAWQPSTFNHSTTRFALTGAHVSTTCVSCHPGGVYTGTPSTCGSSSCHLAKYNATSNPPHTGAGFGTDCQTCHSTSAWVPSTFNHTPWFPISAGSKHSPGRWTACADCHTVPSNYQAFSCIDCHAHSNKAQVDQQHVGRANYTYTSAGCYSCHPRGTN